MKKINKNVYLNVGIESRNTPCIFSKDCSRPKHSSAESCWQSFSRMSYAKWIRGLEEAAIAKAEGGK